VRKFALVPTRRNPTSEDKTAYRLRDYFGKAGYETHWLIGESSIFEAIRKKCKGLNLKPEDIVIICHDDIEIFMEPNAFNNLISDSLDSNTGFLGVAGTPSFGNGAKPCTWWNEKPYGELKGIVWHGGDLMSSYPTYFGKYGRVVVADGVFLCTTGKVLNSIQLKQPKDFSGAWDFYDIFYTFQAYIKGLHNKVIPIPIRHESEGRPRPEWDFNRQSFINLFGKYLPAVVR